MNKIAGVLLLLIYVCVATALLSDNFVKSVNMQNLVRYISLYGIIGIGAGFAIITGGIDLSIGSVIGLVGCSLPMMIEASEGRPAHETAAILTGFLGWELLLVGGLWSAWGGYRRFRGSAKFDFRLPGGLAAAGIVAILAGSGLQTVTLPIWLAWTAILLTCLAIAFHLGLIHGLLITKLKLQPFVVTLCGLMIYRGVARWMTGDQTQGFGNDYDQSLRLLATGRPCTVATLLILVGAGIAAAGLYRVVAARRSPELGSHTAWWVTVFLLGGIMATVGSSRFWSGYEVERGVEIANVFGQSISLWSVTVPPAAAARPGELMRWLGFGLAIPSAIWLAGTTLAIGSRREGGVSRLWLELIAPIVYLFIATGLLWLARWLVGRPDTFLLDDAAWGARLKVSFLLISLALFMTAIAWLGRVTLRIGGPAVRPALLATGALCILGLAGCTAIGQTKLPTPFFFLLGLAGVTSLLLKQTIYGRYLYALGRNEEAARYSGINTDRMVILAYVICALCAGLGGILFALDANSVQPSNLGNFGELYAIAAAVLGGCSLRGGEGSILGIIIGAAVMRALYNSIGLIDIPDQLELAIIGVVILVGVMADELVKRFIGRRGAVRKTVTP